MKKIILFFILLWTVNCKAQGTWSNLGSGITPRPLGVLALCADTVNNILYAGGAFDTAGSVKQNALAKWDGTKWDTTVAIDSGIEVYALIMYHGDLIVGFSNGHIGKYNGDTMAYLPGFNGAAYCFYIYNDTLYAGGEFSKSNSTLLNCIAKWNGTKWLPVDKGFSWYDCCVGIYSMTQYNDELIAAGIFDSAGSVAASSIAAYDGSQWKSLGVNLANYGISAFNGSLGVYKNNLYVAGDFDSINSMYTASEIAVFNGASWDTIFDNTYTTVIQSPSNIAMTVFDGYLFVSGNYNDEVPYKYDGDSVSTVDSGVIGFINSMVVWNGSLYVGGGFNDAVEARPHTPGIARWTPDSTTTKINKLTADNNQLTISPNPFSQQATLQFSQPLNNNAQLILYDLTGRQVENYTISSGATNLIIKRNNLPAGMYFYKVSGSMPILTGKVVIQ